MSRTRNKLASRIRNSGIRTEDPDSKEIFTDLFFILFLPAMIAEDGQKEEDVGGQHQTHVEHLQHKVHIYLEYYSVCLLVVIGTPTPSPASV
jgi:hypothetical protein